MRQNALMLTRVLHEFGLQPVKSLSTASDTGCFTLDDPRKLVAHGLKRVKRGQRVKVVNLGNGKWRVDHLSTGTSITRSIRDILGGKRQPAFRR